VIVVPHGILNYVPFEMLFSEDSVPAESARSFASLPYLILRADVSYVPAAGVLAILRQSPRRPASAPGGGLLLAGDPIVSSTEEMSVFAQAAFPDGLPARAFFREEIGALRGLFRLPKNEPLARDRATVARLRDASRKGQYRYVHFATHGVYNEKHPRCSGLLLTPDPDGGDDGFLSVSEVFGLELECDQVVLSACATALGEDVTGEGILGLTRAFLYAGARSVVAALWEIPGRETAEFMRVFYEELLQNPGIDREHALSEAKRWMIRRNKGGRRGDAPSSHPHFWSAFVLTGVGD
jgi:CHAT domain-containing protein